jgi:hypothetical protein
MNAKFLFKNLAKPGGLGFLAMANLFAHNLFFITSRRIIVHSHPEHFIERKRTLHSRKRISLDGEWNFWTDPDGFLSPVSLPENARLPIHVPGPWQPQLEDLHFYSGSAWYQRTLDVPAEWVEEGRILLGIDAADYITEAWLNEIKVGEHEGGYLPFEFDITHAAQPGQNVLTIRVDDPPALFPEIPHGKQGWYGPLSGIWQSVWLEHRADIYISGFNVYADPDQGCVQAHVSLSEPSGEARQVTAQVISPAGGLVASIQSVISPGGQDCILGLSVQEPLAWSPDAPNLYRLEIQLEDEGGPMDALAKDFGFRTIASRNGKLYLNGEPLYLRAALDQDYHLDLTYSSPDTEQLENQLHKAKELGLNCLRCHIKAADPHYYEVADRLGMLIWTELPNWSIFTESAGRRGREMLKGILDRDGNHPSIIIWTIINENWGMDLLNDQSHRDWLKDTYRWLKALDPTRLVIDNSPCLPNFHIQSDLEDFHFYRAIPDQRKEWDQFVQEFASRPEWTYSPNGDILRTRKEPLIVSEFGVWGLPDAELLQDQKGKDPWWFETGIEWSEGVVYPQGVRKRFNNLGLSRVFGSWQKFIEATQQQQFLGLKYEIEAIRRHPEIKGYVITEFTDVHWECNGLLDMRRKPKAFHGDFKNINADTVIMPVWQRVSYWSGETVQVDIEIAHSTGDAIRQSELRWRLAGEDLGGRLQVGNLLPEQVKKMGCIFFQAPKVTGPAVRRMNLELYSAQGEVLAQNYLDLSIYPPSSAAFRDPAVKLFVPDPELARLLERLGYSLSPSLEKSTAAITGKVDEQILAYVRQGGKLLLLADRSEAPGQIFPGIRVQARKGTPWMGDWASAFSWVSRSGSFARVPGGPLIDHSFDQIIPQHVLLGFRDWDYPTLVHAGTVVGWVHKPAVLVGERFYGNGKAVINTFSLPDNVLGEDPTGTAMMDALIETLLC